MSFFLLDCVGGVKRKNRFPPGGSLPRSEAERHKSCSSAAYDAGERSELSTRASGFRAALQRSRLAHLAVGAADDIRPRYRTAGIGESSSLVKIRLPITSRLCQRPSAPTVTRERFFLGFPTPRLRLLAAPARPRLRLSGSSCWCCGRCMGARAGLGFWFLFCAWVAW